MTNVSRPIHLHLASATALNSDPPNLNNQQANPYCNDENSITSLADSPLPSQIMPYLYVGNQEQTNREILTKLNIKYILSLQSLPRNINCINKQGQIRCKFINISDTFEQILGKVFEEANDFIEEARQNKCNILVHCNAGISRSPTIAIAYLMKWRNLHLQDAYNFVKRCRPQISPNLNFMGQLVRYEERLSRQRRRV